VKVPECFGCHGLTDDCFGCPYEDECEETAIEEADEEKEAKLT
jgi:hypothetical protein